MSNLPDAAYIRNLRNSGYRDGKDPTYPVCPICEQTCETIYISADNEIVGCDHCSYILYKRTSAMNSSEMSHLIDGARQEAQELGIDI